MVPALRRPPPPQLGLTFERGDSSPGLTRLVDALFRPFTRSPTSVVMDLALDFFASVASASQDGAATFAPSGSNLWGSSWPAFRASDESNRKLLWTVVVPGALSAAHAANADYVAAILASFNVTSEGLGLPSRLLRQSPTKSVRPQKRDGLSYYRFSGGGAPPPDSISRSSFNLFLSCDFCDEDHPARIDAGEGRYEVECPPGPHSFGGLPWLRLGGGEP